MKKKKETIKVLSGLEATLMGRERFNPYQTGSGIIKSKKYKKERKSKVIKKALAEY